MMRGGRSAHSVKHGILKDIKALLEYSRLGDLLLAKDLISQDDLSFALARQKETSQALGKIFVAQKIISRRELALMLGRQMLLRLIATALITFLSLSSFSVRRAKADTIRDVPGLISIAAVTDDYSQLGDHAGLFGTAEKRSTNLAAFTKWAGVFSRLEQEMQTTGGRAEIKSLQNDLAPFKGESLKSMAAHVNDLMNEKPYIVDSRNWGQSDYWETPIEFREHGGDCEDFAIAKYVALRMLGVSKSRMRVAIVQDTYKNIPHAILAVYTDEGLYVLDNQIKTLVSAESTGRYRPIFSINREAWWLHSTPDSTQIASR